MKIMLDPGHGGVDPGAVGKHSGIEYHEADINFDIVTEVAALLRGSGFEVILTRAKKTDTMTPGARLRKFNSSGSQAFVSVHCNSSANATATGVEVIYRDDEDIPLANSIYDELLAATGLRDRGLKNDHADLNRTLTVLNPSDKPCCLVEVGFISNPQDVKIITDTERVSVAIANGILNWSRTDHAAV